MCTGLTETNLLNCSNHGTWCMSSLSFRVQISVFEYLTLCVNEKSYEILCRMWDLICFLNAVLMKKLSMFTSFILIIPLPPTPLGRQNNMCKIYISIYAVNHNIEFLSGWRCWFHFTRLDEYLKSPMNMMHIYLSSGERTSIFSANISTTLHHRSPIYSLKYDPQSEFRLHGKKNHCTHTFVYMYTFLSFVSCYHWFGIPKVRSLLAWYVLKTYTFFFFRMCKVEKKSLYNIYSQLRFLTTALFIAT